MAGDAWNPVCPSRRSLYLLLVSLRTVLSFVDGWMWTLRTAVVLSVGLLDPSFSVYRDGYLSFSVSVLWSVFVVFSWERCWTRQCSLGM